VEVEVLTLEQAHHQLILVQVFKDNMRQYLEIRDHLNVVMAEEDQQVIGECHQLQLSAQRLAVLVEVLGLMAA
jgi:hypothetical protein